MPEPEEIRLLFQYKQAWEDGAGRDKRVENATEGNVDDEEWNVAVIGVQRLQDDQFRVEGPTSLSPLGPYGPFLDLGTVIRAVAAEEGSYRLRAIVDRPKLWNWTIPSEPSSLERPGVAAILDQLMEMGCGWEWCAGNLTIQRASEAPGLPLLKDFEGRIETLCKALSAEG